MFIVVCAHGRFFAWNASHKKTYREFMAKNREDKEQRGIEANSRIRVPNEMTWRPQIICYFWRGMQNIPKLFAASWLWMTTSSVLYGVLWIYIDINLRVELCRWGGFWKRNLDTGKLAWLLDISEVDSYYECQGISPTIPCTRTLQNPPSFTSQTSHPLLHN